MPTPTLYNAFAARLHGSRRLAGLGFLVFILLTVLCIVAVRAGLLSPSQVLAAGLVFLFSLAAWSAGVYLLCDWFDPQEGYLRSYLRPPPPGARRTSWIGSLVPWISALFLDVAFLGAAALTLSALYRVIA